MKLCLTNKKIAIPGKKEKAVGTKRKSLFSNCLITHIFIYSEAFISSDSVGLARLSVTGLAALI